MKNLDTHRCSHRDSVSSVGFFRNKVLPGTADGMKHVSVFRHALALDERRIKFLPEYVNEGLCKSDSVPASSNSAVRATGPGEKNSKQDTTAGQVPTTEDLSCPMSTPESMYNHKPPARH